jgi:hypothetical protein
VVVVVHPHVEQLLAEAPEPEIRDLLDACALVRQFDEATLAAVSGQTGCAGSRSSGPPRTG